MDGIRKWIALAEGLRPVVGSPQHFYHGTNIAAACAILRDGIIRAEHPNDDDGLGPVVCVTEEPDVGHMFAVEFARANSDYPVGVVFTLNAVDILGHFEAVPYHADTTGTVEEAEYRIKGDIPLKPYCTAVKLVGDLDELRNSALKAQIFNDWKHLFSGREEFNRLWTRLIRTAKSTA